MISFLQSPVHSYFVFPSTTWSCLLFPARGRSVNSRVQQVGCGIINYGRAIDFTVKQCVLSGAHRLLTARLWLHCLRTWSFQLVYYSNPLITSSSVGLSKHTGQRLLWPGFDPVRPPNTTTTSTTPPGLPACCKKKHPKLWFPRFPNNPPTLLRASAHAFNVAASLLLLFCIRIQINKLLITRS